MTDFKDKDQQDQQRSFKEQILAELEKANQIRKEKEEELFQKESIAHNNKTAKHFQAIKDAVMTSEALKPTLLSEKENSSLKT
ncbi:TPA: aminodeoxychorismate lyase, partial [Streptococcus pyogenes]